MASVNLTNLFVVPTTSFPIAKDKEILFRYFLVTLHHKYRARKKRWQPGAAMNLRADGIVPQR